MAKNTLADEGSGSEEPHDTQKSLVDGAENTYSNAFSGRGVEIGAFVVSICALFLTIYQTLETRKHNELSVRPHIVFIKENDKIAIKNNGLGPALFESLVIKYKGKVYSYNEIGIASLLVAIDPECKKETENLLGKHCGLYGATLLSQGDAISVGDSKSLLYCKNEEEDSYNECKRLGVLNPYQADPQIEMEIKFLDFYSTKFTEVSLK